jgi:hypothetical protein
MKTILLTPQALRQRKFLLMLPLLVIPFATLLFWALGGGQVSHAGQIPTGQKGLNTMLPNAQLKDQRKFNKLSYYDQADQDSLRLSQLKRSDPYYQDSNPPDTARLHFPRPAGDQGLQTGLGSGELPLNRPEAAGATRVYQKLTELQTAINRPAPVYPAKSTGISKPPSLDIPGSSFPPAAAEDPELKQMNAMLEKILAIQHPEQATDHQAAAALPKPLHRFTAIPASVDGNQKITVGSVVRIKLLDTVTLSGQLIPKGTLIFGSGVLANQRLTLNLRIVHLGLSIIPVNLAVYDQTDGLEGISVPEAVTGEAIREGSGNAIQGVEFMSLDQTVAAQAANAGLNTVRGLFSKKVRRIKAKLKGGHLLLLRNRQTEE